MPHFPGNPRSRFPHPANLEILDVLERDASPPPTNLEKILFEIDDYELSTYPELYDCLRAISQSLPEDCFSAAFGYAILATSGGVIFGVARGNAYIALRISSNMAPQASELNNYHYDDDPLSWARFDGLSNLDAWGRRAYDYAKQLE